MNLLIFAHRGEAQHFLKQDNYKPAVFKGLYKSKNNYLLLSGEGIESTSKKLTPVVEKFKEQISKVINFGIAGALDQNLESGSIYSIREVFCENNKMSFQSADKNSAIDCVSAINRVVKLEYANLLLNKAPLVDMELWAIANICQNNSIPWNSYKLISDHAGKSTSIENIKDNAANFSFKLYKFYKRIFTNNFST